jgi:hypothetical protein
LIIVPENLSCSDGKTLLSPHRKVGDHSFTLFSLLFFLIFYSGKTLFTKNSIFFNVKKDPSDMEQSFIDFKKIWWNNFMTSSELRNYPNGKKINMTNSIIGHFFRIKFFLEWNVGLQCFSRNWKNQHLTKLQHLNIKFRFNFSWNLGGQEEKKDKLKNCCPTLFIGIAHNGFKCFLKEYCLFCV